MPMSAPPCMYARSLPSIFKSMVVVFLAKFVMSEGRNYPVCMLSPCPTPAQDVAREGVLDDFPLLRPEKKTVS